MRHSNIHTIEVSSIAALLAHLLKLMQTLGTFCATNCAFELQLIL